MKISFACHVHEIHKFLQCTLHPENCICGGSMVRAGGTALILLKMFHAYQKIGSDKLLVVCS